MSYIEQKYDRTDTSMLAPNDVNPYMHAFIRCRRGHMCQVKQLNALELMHLLCGFAARCFCVPVATGLIVSMTTTAHYIWLFMKKQVRIPWLVREQRGVLTTGKICYDTVLQRRDDMKEDA
ncbi:hypothetical protein BCR43DRAFT_508073 [Syncephalastrum racemosum]|uniref:Uncharacterized protein n=1 Tax=Syncephalastrum racemosum TaxID=13706 RepID=A0A1X2H2A1_SYNRA|nr:hypothetical protein BCR43DRAFT_508073 [Syncephalastrum racemosum]